MDEELLRRRVEVQIADALRHADDLRRELEAFRDDRHDDRLTGGEIVEAIVAERVRAPR